MSNDGVGLAYVEVVPREPGAARSGDVLDRWVRAKVGVSEGEQVAARVAGEGHSHVVHDRRPRGDEVAVLGGVDGLGRPLDDVVVHSAAQLDAERVDLEREVSLSRGPT